MIFHYIFEFKDNNIKEFIIDTENNFANRVNDPKKRNWTELNQFTCSICTVNPEKYKYCPLSLDIIEITDAFKDVKSFETVNVKVVNEDRTYFKNTDMQSALASLLGLVMASSDCPVTSQLRHLAHFHLPFSSYEETIIRVTGGYLLKQYIQSSNNKKPDWAMKDLEKLYKDLIIINRAMKERISHCDFDYDANVNAFNVFFSLSSLVELSLQEQIGDIKKYFDL
jgi:hypothetical protein